MHLLEVLFHISFCMRFNGFQFSSYSQNRSFKVCFMAFWKGRVSKTIKILPKRNCLLANEFILAITSVWWLILPLWSPDVTVCPNFKQFLSWDYAEWKLHCGQSETHWKCSMFFKNEWKLLYFTVSYVHILLFLVMQRKLCLIGARKGKWREWLACWNGMKLTTKINRLVFGGGGGGLCKGEGEGNYLHAETGWS